MKRAHKWAIGALCLATAGGGLTPLFLESSSSFASLAGFPRQSILLRKYSNRTVITEQYAVNTEEFESLFKSIDREVKTAKSSWHLETKVPDAVTVNPVTKKKTRLFPTTILISRMASPLDELRIRLKKSLGLNGYQVLEFPKELKIDSQVKLQ